MRALALLLAATLLGGCASLNVHVNEAQLPRQVELEAVPFFPQEEYQCGPAALATVLVHQGIDTSDQQLVDRVYLPARQGSLQVEMVAAARSHGMLVYPLERRLEAILGEVAAGNPVLVLQNLAFKRWPYWHFAVVVGYDLDEQTLILRSGTERRQEESFRRFLRSWHNAERWAVVTTPPDQLPATAELLPWMQAASDLEQSGNPKSAMTAYRSAANEWQSGLPWFAMANLYYRDGLLGEAEQALRQALSIQPDFQPAWTNLAHVLGERGCAATSARAKACAARLKASGEQQALAVTAAGTEQPECEAPACPLD